MDNMVNAQNPDPAWHGFKVGYITIYRTLFAVGTPQEVEVAERALGSHCLASAPVCVGHGRDTVTTCRVIFGR